MSNSDRAGDPPDDHVSAARVFEGLDPAGATSPLVGAEAGNVLGRGGRPARRRRVPHRQPASRRHRALDRGFVRGGRSSRAARLHLGNRAAKEAVPPELLRVTVRFEPRDEKTEVIVVHEQIDSRGDPRRSRTGLARMPRRPCRAVCRLIGENCHMRNLTYV